MQENRGLTLVELMITIGILSIVVIIAGSFMLTSGNSFAKGNADSDIQEEAQLAVNQIEDLIIDGVGVETTDDADKKELVLYHTEEEAGVGTKFIKEAVIWKKDGSNNMYYSKWEVSEDPVTGNYVENGPAIYSEQLLAENVIDFKIDLETVTEKATDGTDVTVVRSVQIAVGCESGVGVGSAAYATTPLITLRNRMIQGDPKLVFKDVPISDDTLVLFYAKEGEGEGTAVPIVDRVSSVERGKGYNIFAMQESTTNVNNLVNWQIVEGDATSTIDAGGLLRVGQFEPNSYLTVVARYKSNPNKMARGVLKVEGGSTKSLDAVEITTKSLLAFNPKYGSIVTTTGFSDEERAALHYKWTVTAPERVESFTDNTPGLELKIKQEEENYGKIFTITLVVSSDVTGQKVSDSITYRIDQKGTTGGDSSMERGRGNDGESDHGLNNYPYTEPKYQKPVITVSFYFCDEYGEKISKYDIYNDYVDIRLRGSTEGGGAGGYALTFTKDLPPDNSYFIKVIVRYDDEITGSTWTYERIHFISKVTLAGEKTKAGPANVYGAFSTYYEVMGYRVLGWQLNHPMQYEVTLDYEAPEGVTVEAEYRGTNVNGEHELKADFGFKVDLGPNYNALWQVQNEIKIKSATIKVSMTEYPDIYTYCTVVFE